VCFAAACVIPLQVLGTDADVEPMLARGLQAVPTVGGPLGRLLEGSLAAARAHAVAAGWHGGGFDAVLLMGSSAEESGAFARWWAAESLEELTLAIKPSGGALCAEMTLEEGTNPAAVLQGLRACGLMLRDWQVVQLGGGRAGSALRLVAWRLPRG